MSESESRLNIVEQAVLDTLGYRPMRSSALWEATGYDRIEVQDALWKLNSLGKVRVTPDSRWELVESA